MEKQKYTNRYGEEIPICVALNFAPYRTAGIIPISLDQDDDVCMLLGIETRRERDVKTKTTSINDYLIDIAGKIDDKDCCCSFMTAIREFHEETCDYFIGNITINKVFKLRKIWVPQSKSMIYLIYIEYRMYDYKRIDKGDTMKALKWVKMKELFHNKEMYQETIKIHPRLKYIVDLL
jgi:hypothetical protein